MEWTPIDQVMPQPYRYVLILPVYGNWFRGMWTGKHWISGLSVNHSEYEPEFAYAWLDVPEPPADLRVLMPK